MRKQIVGSVVVAVALCCPLVGASGASAAVEFGSNCAASSAVPEYSLTTLSAPGPLPVTSPSAGVVTTLKTNVPLSIPFSVPTTVKVLRPAGGSNQFTTVAQQQVLIPPGVNSLAARLPVQAGDRLGIHGDPFTYEGSPSPGIALYCTLAGAELGAVKADIPVGSTAAYPPATAGAVPIVGVVEPDADGDGYGDETQDKCPQSAAVQTACPKVKVEFVSLAGESSVTVLVTTNISAPVLVTGSVKLGNGKKAKLKAAKKTVAPGKFGRFKLKFTGPLQARLGELASGEKLKLKVTAKATNVAGQVSKSTRSVNLGGQG